MLARLAVRPLARTSGGAAPAGTKGARDRSVRWSGVRGARQRVGRHARSFLDRAIQPLRRSAWGALPWTSAPRTVSASSGHGGAHVPDDAERGESPHTDRCAVQPLFTGVDVDIFWFERLGASASEQRSRRRATSVAAP